MSNDLDIDARMALLDEVLSDIAPEELLRKLQQYPAYGPTLDEFEQDSDILFFRSFGYEVISFSPIELRKDGGICISGNFVHELKTALYNSTFDDKNCEYSLLANDLERLKKVYEISYFKENRYELKAIDGSIAVNDIHLLKHIVKNLPA